MQNIIRFGYKIGIKFNKSILVLERNKWATKLVNACIAYDLDNCSRNPLKNFALKNYFLCGTNIVKSSTKSKYVYGGFEIDFDGGDSWSYGNDVALLRYNFWC